MKKLLIALLFVLPVTAFTANPVIRYPSYLTDYTESGRACGNVTAVLNEIQRFYKMAYHGQMTLSNAEEYVDAQIAVFEEDPVTVRLLIFASNEAKSEIFQGRDSQSEIEKMNYGFFKYCKANFNTLRQGDPQDRLIDYSKQR